jgi:hypothetical protein
MKKLLGLLICTITFFAAPQAKASESKLPYGAAPLSSRTLSIGADIGIDPVNTFLYNLRLDYGLGSRFQVGISGSFWGFLNTLEPSLLANILKSSDNHHFLSLRLNTPLYHTKGIYFDEENNLNDINVFLFSIHPELAYEYRKSTNTGIYTKVGTYHLLAASANGELFGLLDEGLKPAISIKAGLQHNTGKNFTIGFEAGSYFVPGKAFDPIGLAGKLRLAVVF